MSTQLETVKFYYALKFKKNETENHLNANR